MVFAIIIITTIVVKYPCVWRQCVHEQQFIWLFVYKTIWFGKCEVFTKRAVDEYTINTGRIVITRCVIFAIETAVECGVHKQV